MKSKWITKIATSAATVILAAGAAQFVYAEEVGTENVSTENVSTENVSTENVSAENVSTENVSAENVSTEDGINSAAVYAEVLAQVKDILEGGNKAEQWGELHYSDLYSSMDGDALSKVGYLFMDLNEDGNDELLVGKLDEDEIYDLFTVVKGEAAHVLSGTEDGRYSLAKERDAYAICLTKKATAQQSEVYYFGLTQNSTVPYIKTGFIYNEIRDPANPYFLDFGTCEIQRSKKELSEQRRTAFSDPIEISYEALADYETLKN